MEFFPETKKKEALVMEEEEEEARFRSRKMTGMRKRKKPDCD